MLTETSALVLCSQRHCHLQAVNFFSFDMFRKTFTRLGGGTFSNEARLTAGALAGTQVFTPSAQHLTRLTKCVGCMQQHCSRPAISVTCTRNSGMDSV